MWILSLCLIHALAVMSPGPDFIVVMRLSLSSGTRYGLAAAFGVMLSNGALLLAAIAGTSALAEQSPMLMTAIQVAGALYLGYIGIRCLQSKAANPGQPKLSESDLATPSLWKAFQDGFLTCLLNSKAIIYFISIASQFTVEGDIFAKVAAIATILLITLVWFSFISFIAGLPTIRAKLQTRTHIIDRVMGAVLIGYCLFILFRLF